MSETQSGINGMAPFVPLMERLSKEEKEALKAGMEELRLRFKQRQATSSPHLEPPPGRFDEVYERGVEWLNRLLV